MDKTIRLTCSKVETEEVDMRDIITNRGSDTPFSKFPVQKSYSVQVQD